MFNKNYLIGIINMLLFTALWTGCTAYDDYLKYVEGGEIIYPQKADSVKTFAGRNRILLKWQTLDPRVMGFNVIYGYAGRFDSLRVPAVHSEAYSVDTVSCIIGSLEETSYTFRIVSFDAAGNKSLVVEAAETAYGAMYEKNLFNRVVRSRQPGENELELEWYDAGASEIGIELKYHATGGTTQTVFTPSSENSSYLPDFDYAFPLSYRTLYKPAETSIDTFSAVTVEEMVSFPSQLTNNHTPFAVTDRGMWQSGGRFGTLAGWKMNDMASPESVDNDGGATWITFVTGWGLNENKAITDGKIWQTLSLDPGEYQLSATIANMQANGHIFLAAAKGFHIPDTEDIESALGYCELSTDSRPAKNDVLSCTFKLDSPSLVTVGMVANVTPETTAGVYAIDLEKIE
jgi:hypothetical protein